MQRNKLVFATAIRFHRSMIFAGKARNLTLEWSPVRVSTQVGSSLSRIYETAVENNDSNKDSSLIFWSQFNKTFL
jgi:hypothetical protein